MLILTVSITHRIAFFGDIYIIQPCQISRYCPSVTHPDCVSASVILSPDIGSFCLMCSVARFLREKITEQSSYDS